MSGLQNSLIIPDWPAPSNVKSIITTREGGVSQNHFASFNIGQHVEDNPDHVKANREELRKILPNEPVWLRQVHGNKVIHADNNTLQNLEADAVVTDIANVVLSIQTADCLPVLLCDRKGTAIGACHAGWRGLSNDIIENTIGEMNCPPQSIIAYLGPAIGPEKFEVGQDVADEFVKKHATAADAFAPISSTKWLANIYMLAKIRLSAAGVTNVYGGNFCTYSDDTRFFSYRRSKQTGRMASLMWLEE